MTRTSIRLAVCLLLMCSALPLIAASAASADSVVPGMVKFAGTLNDVSGKPLTGTVGVTFLLYKEQSGGAPLWMETQNVQADKNGHYSVMLGSATSHGIPASAFAAGEARWLGVQPSGQDEQPRAMLASVPYSLKALDAETLGGRPASSFMSLPTAGARGSSQPPPAPLVNEIVCATGSACKKGFLAAFATTGGSAKVGSSIIKQSGTTINVDGSETVDGDLSAGGKITATGSVSASDISASGSLTTPGFVSASTMSASNATVANGFVVMSGTALASGAAGTTGGVYGQSNSDSGRGVWGRGTGANSTGVFGETFAGGIGVFGVTGQPSGIGTAGINDAGGDGLYGEAVNGGFAGFFLGDVDVDGVLSKAAGSFKIDHPLDPANKYLYHSFVESPDMMNIYNGTVTTDAQGSAIVEMPDWFEALNRDFRYQLTVIGQFAQAIVASKMADHHFSIKTDKSNVEVSWQVTGIRHDAFADAHRIPVEQVKADKERGFYMHPELFGASAEKSIAAARHPGVRPLANQGKIKLTGPIQQ